MPVTDGSLKVTGSAVVASGQAGTDLRIETAAPNGTGSRPVIVQHCFTTSAARTVHSPGKNYFLNFPMAGLNHSLWACRNSYIWPDEHRISTFPAA